MLLFAIIPTIMITVAAVLVLVVVSLFTKHKEDGLTAGGSVLAGVHFIGLMAVVLAVAQIGFALIEANIPDLLVDNTWGRQSMLDAARTSLAILIIGGPLYLLFVCKGEQASRPEVLWTKKFLASAILFIGGFTAVIALILLVNDFISGDLGLRKGLEIGLVIALALGVSSYYQVFIRDYTAKIRNTATRIYFSAVIIVIITAIIGGFLTVGGPAVVRAERFDDRRLSDLSSMQWSIQSYANEKRALPKDLLALHDPVRGFAVPADPKTKAPYTYRIVRESTEQLPERNATHFIGTFEFCATFESVRDENDDSDAYKDTGASINPTRATGPGLYDRSSLPNYYEGNATPFWNHPIGSHCFERTIDIEFPDTSSKQSLSVFAEPVYIN